jgi:hypothetical protein
MNTHAQPQPTTRSPSALNEILVVVGLSALGAAWLLSLARLEPAPIGWVTMRVTGFVSYAALAVTTALGPLVATRYAPSWLPAFMSRGWHGILSGFALALGALHGAFILVGGEYAQGLAALLIPGMSRTDPFAVGLGTLSVYLLLIVYYSFVHRARLGMRWARALHFLAYPAFIMATAHGFLAGSDPAMPLYVVASVLVSVTTALRIARS